MSVFCVSSTYTQDTHRVATVNRAQRRSHESAFDGAVVKISDNPADEGTADLIIGDISTADDTIVVVATPMFIETEHDQDFDR